MLSFVFVETLIRAVSIRFFRLLAGIPGAFSSSRREIHFSADRSAEVATLFLRVKEGRSARVGDRSRTRSRSVAKPLSKPAGLKSWKKEREEGRAFSKRGNTKLRAASFTGRPFVGVCRPSSRIYVDEGDCAAPRPNSSGGRAGDKLEERSKSCAQHYKLQ